MTADKKGHKRPKHAPQHANPKVTLDDNDIERVLKVMGSNYSLAKPEQRLLKEQINRGLEFANKLYQHHEYHTPHLTK
jgi:hypothetical protein